MEGGLEARKYVQNYVLIYLGIEYLLVRLRVHQIYDVRVLSLIYI